jgi:hypothetical protein
MKLSCDGYPARLYPGLAEVVPLPQNPLTTMNQNASLNITVGAIKFTQNKYSTGAHLENVLPSLFVPALYNTGSSLAPAILRAPLLTDRKLRLVRHTGQRKGYDGAAKASA